MFDFFFSLYNYNDFALLFLRIIIGAIFLHHGMDKIKHARGKYLALGFAEMAGSIGMFTGLLAQPAAVGLAIVMLGATYMKKFRWHTPFVSNTSTGYELDLMILASCLLILVMGAGAFSLDRVWFNL